MNQKHGWIDALLDEVNPDVVLVTGDIFETSYTVDPYKKLAYLFDNITTICTFGNHEFFDRTVEATHRLYREKYDPSKYDVHYLDIVGSYSVEDVNFFGNVLWYDGTNSTVDQNIYSFANGGWSDRLIFDFDWYNECMLCIDQIKENYNPDQVNVLCTHCVPHAKMNKHLVKKNSLYNAYSGVSNLFSVLDEEMVDNILYAFSGHTHLRSEAELHGITCVNIGSDRVVRKHYNFTV